MSAMQRPQPGHAAAHKSAARLFWAAALLVLGAVGCGDDSTVTDASDGGEREPDAAGPPADGGANDGGMQGRPDGGGGEPDAGGGSGEPTREALVNHALWQVVEASDDPFEDRPASVSCPESAYGDERLGGPLTFFVDSELCSYITVSQGSRAPVSAGDEVEVQFSHFALTGADAGQAQAHVAFMLGDTLIVERTISIPADEQQYTWTWTATEDVEESTPVYFHLHNHGMNEYNVRSIEVISE